MASLLYPKGKEKLLSASINLLTDTIKAALVDGADYSYSASHEFYSSISAGVVGTPQTLTNKSVTNGVFNADDVTIPTVTGDQCELIALYKDTGNPATSPLISLIDTATGLPVTPNGTNITFQWHGTGIFGI